ncbi:MAG TPA: anion transporter [Tepidisphaeraceae bacterium]|nr:anion transporter [Tepidisphaeraceae bacterium]
MIFSSDLAALPRVSVHVRDGLMWAIFAVTYLGMALGRMPWLVIDRTGIALLGGIAMLVVGGVTFPQAIAHIDFETLALLFGLMVFSGQLRAAGFYDVVGRRLTAHAQHPKRLLAGVIGVSAVVSALLANDIVCLAFTPLICTSLLKARRDPIPYLVALATASNIGSAATVIGNPQNMYIGTVARLPFGHFTALMTPPVLVGLGVCWIAIALIFHRRLHWNGQELSGEDASVGECYFPNSPLNLQPAAGAGARLAAYDGILIAKTLILLAMLIVCFLFARGQWRAVAALAGAGVLLLSTRAKAAALHERVDWSLMLLFIGLFIVNGAMQQHGLIQRVFQAFASHGLALGRPITLSGVTLLLSNIVSNVPAVLLLQPAVARAHDESLWYLLALVSTLAGNLTLVGSIANLIVAESAAKLGVRLDLKTYCKVGVPVTIVTVALGTWWMVARK